MFKRFSNSWQLFKASLDVLKKDRELLWFPVFSSLAAVLVFASFIVPAAIWGSHAPEYQPGEEIPYAFFAGVFVFYVVLYFVIIFFNTALVGASLMRLDGRDPTVGDGLRIAWNRIGTILGYALIAATVGVILQAIERRVGSIGKIVIGLLGVTWTAASFLVVPVMVTRDLGPVGAVKESAQLLRQSWGENVIGHLGLGAVFMVIYIALAGLFFIAAIPLTRALGAGASGVPAGLLILAAVAVPAFLLLMAVQAALSGIYSAALYRFASSHEASGAFPATLLETAVTTK